jgi:hypothetical protein
MSSAFGQKLRLNVVALISEATVGRLLVCIDDQALIEDLASKVRCALAKSAIDGHLLRLTNSFGANLPSDEKAGDVLRDAEEVIAVLTAEPEDPIVRQQLAGGVGEIMSFARASPSPQELIAANVGGAWPRLHRNPGGEELTPMPFSGGEDSFVTALPVSPKGQQIMQPVTAVGGVGGGAASLPGPAETFEEDLLDLPDKRAVAPSRLPSGSDWTVEGLTPKLREYISMRFREANGSSAENGNSFIAVTMRPRTRAGAMPTQPIHYSMARIDVVEFERLCAQKVQEARARVDHFQRCQQTLNSLVDRGASGSEYAPNLLPYRYRDEDKFSELLSEADMPTFGQVEGFRPAIVIDNSLAVGETLVFIRSALKRILYSFLVAKSKFNLLKFSPQGNPVAWANGMVPPTAQVLREAEDFLDGIKPIRHNHSANLLEGIQMALAHPEADVVYVLTSGLPRRCSLEGALRSLRSMNIRDLPVHIVGVECEPKAELELRRLAEDNHGSFRHKRFGPSLGSFGSTSSMGGDIAASRDARDNDGKFSITGQLNILEIMLDEQERCTVDWLEEQKCANRLLLTTASQQAVPDVDDARAMYQRAALADVRRQAGDSESRLQELVDAHIGRSPAPSTAAAAFEASFSGGYAGTPRRRVGASAEKRASSVPRGAGFAAVDAIRRPSVVNPWDRPGAVIKASQLVGKNSKGSGPLPPRAGRPQSARSRPSSANRADSARRRVY